MFQEACGQSSPKQLAIHIRLIKPPIPIISGYSPTCSSASSKIPAQVISLSFNRRISRPTFWNLNPYKSLYSPYSFGEGNPSLQPAYTTNIELAHKYKSKLATSLFFNLTRNGFTNLIVVSPDTNLVFTKPFNFIKTYRGGVSIGWSGNISSWWESYALVNGYYTSAISSIPEVDNRSGFGLYISSNNTFYLNKNKTLAAALNFWHQFHEVDRIGRSSNYYKLDIGGRATLSEKVELSLTLNDALRKSAPALDMLVNGLDERFTGFQFNRYLLLTFNYRFGKKKNDQKQEPGQPGRTQQGPLKRQLFFPEGCWIFTRKFLEGLIKMRKVLKSAGITGGCNRIVLQQ